ncbi:MAG: hypothetical protein CMM54_11425 [Rhodospirillaceae bacterium]|nr:hypothetical protein [Rhodospirillaceae bacterium]
MAEIMQAIIRIWVAGDYSQSLLSEAGGFVSIVDGRQFGMSIGAFVLWRGDARSGGWGSWPRGGPRGTVGMLGDGLDDHGDLIRGG